MLRYTISACLFAVAGAGAILGAQGGAATRPFVEESAIPFESMKAEAKDGQPVTALMRKPPGKGPFPALVYLHGALEPWPLGQLKDELMRPSLSRFLAAGYVVVIPSLRRKRDDPQSQYALWDGLATVDAVRKIPGIDSRSIVLWGDSGGGSLAMEMAGETQVAAIALQEPATVLFTGMYGPEHGATRGAAEKLMNEPRAYYTPEIEKKTREKVRKITCPIFIAYSDVHAINRINNEIIIPELKKAGRNLEVKFYPGEPHGFSRSMGSPQAAKSFFEDADRFLRKHLRTQPMPILSSLVKQSPDGGKPKSDEPRP